jgi:hypothetical protein
MHQKIKKLVIFQAEYSNYVNGALSLLGRALIYLHENMFCNYKLQVFLILIALV